MDTRSTRSELRHTAHRLEAIADHFGRPEDLINPMVSGLHALNILQADIEALKRAERAAVAQARAAGATWAQVGETLQITRQAAHERFRSV